jgi:hypothetical protein
MASMMKMQVATVRRNHGISTSAWLCCIVTHSTRSMKSRFAIEAMRMAQDLSFGAVKFQITSFQES